MYSNFSLEDLFFVSGLTHSEIRRGEKYPAFNLMLELFLHGECVVICRTFSFSSWLWKSEKEND